MSFSNGVFSINSTGQPVVTGTVISSTAFNALTTDLATGLSTCILKDGTQQVTGNIPMNNFKLTGVGAATARTDAATLASIQDGTGVYVTAVGGTADVITLTPSPAITVYTAGQKFQFVSSGANTTNVTVNISGLGAKAVTKNGATALIANDIPASSVVSITYDGTQFQLTNVATATNVTGTVGVANGGTGLTTATAYAILCGGTTGTGAFQSIASVGSAGQVLKSNGAGALPSFQGGSPPTVQVITATGTYTAPAGLTGAIVEICGGGGGGGGANASNGAGGGGAGGYAMRRLTAAQIGASQTVTIGAGGAGGGPGSNGVGGNTTSFGALLSATGGGGGTSDAAGNAGGGAGSTGGDLNSSGGDGFYGRPNATSGNGGPSFFGGGGAGQSSLLPGNGSGGKASGSGGGGAFGASYSGGAGANGLCIVTEFY